MRLLPQIIFLHLLLLTFDGTGQTVKKENPILFGETIFGVSSGYTGGFTVGLDISYQVRRNLYTVRYSDNSKFSLNLISFSPVNALPLIDIYSYLDEFSILYGYR